MGQREPPTPPDLTDLKKVIAELLKASECYFSVDSTNRTASCIRVKVNCKNADSCGEEEDTHTTGGIGKILLPLRRASAP